MFGAAITAPARVGAQTATPPAPGRPGTTEPLDLLPTIGKIGASVGFRGGWTRQPYELGAGAQGAAFIRLPLKQVGNGVLSYEILIGYSQSKSDPFIATSAVAFVANLAATGRGDQGPFPVRRLVRSEGRIVNIEPASLVYTWHSRAIRPYVALGAGLAVILTREIPESDQSAIFNGTSPFDAPLIGGQIAQAAELEALGRPSGQGNVKPSGHIGAGFEWRASPTFSLQADYRYSRVGGRLGGLQSASAGFGLHF
jgi:hypothetical protein